MTAIIKWRCELTCGCADIAPYRRMVGQLIICEAHGNARVRAAAPAVDGRTEVGDAH